MLVPSLLWMDVLPEGDGQAVDAALFRIAVVKLMRLDGLTHEMSDHKYEFSFHICTIGPGWRIKLQRTMRRAADAEGAPSRYG